MNIATAKSRESFPLRAAGEDEPAVVWSGQASGRMRSRLSAWYATAKRDLPWRRTADPYAITVSELMLQQTQVVTVIPHYERWLKQFPTWVELASASEDAVLKAWEGLGYYRRARNLHALAKLVAAEGGVMPRTADGLGALPGIGPYTSAAVGSIAFGLPLAVLDGNVMRVLTRLRALKDDISLPRTRRKLQRIADEFLDSTNPSTHNQAMMELGATVCIPGRPLCLICPLNADCAGRSHAQDFPVKSTVATVKRHETIALIRRDGRFYCERVGPGKPWHGLWRFPDLDTARMIAGARIARLKYGITRYAVAMEAVSATWAIEPPSPGGTLQEAAGHSGVYLAFEEMEALAFAAPHRKLARMLR